jgi:hypothetical protein
MSRPLERMLDVLVSRALLFAEELVTSLLAREAHYGRIHVCARWPVDEHAAHNGRVRRMPGRCDKPSGRRCCILSHKPAALVSECDAGFGV